MMGIERLVADYGGVIATFQFYEHWWQSMLQQLVGYGTLIRVRRGWYATAQTPAAIVRACRAGGRLGCVSALEWRDGEPIADPLHVVVPRNSGRLAEQPGVILHWIDDFRDGDNGAVGTHTAQSQAARCRLSARSASARSPS